MKLSNSEFNWMNSGFRRYLQSRVEYPTFKKMGLSELNRDILEIGCGSGYGAFLLSELSPKSYDGIDLMPEQINLAKNRKLDNFNFHVMDATNLTYFKDKSKDYIVIYGILHHINEWRNVIDDCLRILRPGGRLFVTEPNFQEHQKSLDKWNKIMKWDHPYSFSLKELEEHILKRGFELTNKKYTMFKIFGYYCALKLNFI